MSALVVVAVAVGGAIGAALRYVVDAAAKARRPGPWPWGTFGVNVVGSVLLGAFTAAAPRLGPALTALLGAGFCGALTTYSTFAWEAWRLGCDGRRRLAWGYALGTVAACVAAAACGHLAAGAVLGLR